jgi:hypothetical protein
MTCGRCRRWCMRSGGRLLRRGWLRVGCSQQERLQSLGRPPGLDAGVRGVGGGWVSWDCKGSGVGAGTCCSGYPTIIRRELIHVRCVPKAEVDA